jgi:N-acyl-D-amino-acid deacylase
MRPLDELFRRFLAENELPGVAAAVTRDGELVYARGFGYADVERRAPMRAESLLRIASLSKPITGAAVLKLVEQGKLKLDARVVEVLKLGPALDDLPDADSRWRQITVRQLLHHTAGFDRHQSFDPMFRSVEIARHFDTQPPAEADQIIRYMLARPLDFDPGARFAYSNFGYCLLGRVIEQASGRPYEQFVRQEILAPLGVATMRVGRTLPGGRAEGEVRYYTRDDATGPAVIGEKIGAPVPLPYGAWYLEAMDSHGGWIASAVDLARFAAALDDPRRCPILAPESVAALFARPAPPVGRNDDGSPADVWYGCGWSVRQVGGRGQNTWHLGSLDGTSTLLVRRHDGLNWAVLFNSRQTADGEEPARKIDPLMHRAIDAALGEKAESREPRGESQTR